MSKNIVSLQIKAHEVYIKPLKPRESILTIQESDKEEDDAIDDDSEEVAKLIKESISNTDD